MLTKCLWSSFDSAPLPSLSELIVDEKGANEAPIVKTSDKKRYLVKINCNPDTLKAEVLADAFYLRLGFNIPQSSVYKASYNELPEAIKSSVAKPNNETEIMLFQLVEYLEPNNDLPEEVKRLRTIINELLSAKDDQTALKKAFTRIKPKEIQKYSQLLQNHRKMLFELFNEINETIGFDQSEKVLENIVDHLQLIAKRHQLVDTTLRRGHMQYELINKKIKEKTANPSSSSNANHKRSDVQSDIHFQAVMGEQFKKYDTPEKKVQAFNLIYSPFPVVMNDVQEKQFIKMLTEEERHQGKYPVYTGSDGAIAFLNDLMSEFRRQIELQYKENFTVLRANDDPFSFYQDVTDFMSRNDFDRSACYGLFGLSINAFPFGGTSRWEASYYYFLQNWSQEHPEIKEFFDGFFKRLNIDADFSFFEKIYEEFAKTMGGVIYQIFIDASCVDQIAKPAALNGRQNPLSTDHGKLNQFSEVIQEMRANPGKYAEYIKTFQGRMYLNPEFLHDTEKVEFITYRSIPLTSEQEQKYKNALTEAVSEHLIKPLLINYQKLPPTAFARAKGKPGLHRQMGMVYQSNGMADSGRPDVIVSIPELISEKNVKGIVENIVETPDFDLGKALYDIKPLYRPPILLDFFENNLSLSNEIYLALQQYKDKEHVAKVLQELQPIALYYSISIGDLDSAGKLFQQELNRNVGYLSPERYRKRLLEEGLTVAAKHNQFEIFDWLMQECQKFNYEPFGTHSLSSESILEITIKQGHYKFVAHILSVSKPQKLTAEHFNEMLLLAKKHHHLEIITVILEKLMTMPKDIVEMVLMQENSILIYLNNNRQESILKKLDISIEKLTSDARVLIPKLLHQGNVAGLVEAIANTENFDLSCQLIAEGSHPKSRCTLLDRFDNHIVVSAQVFIELQQYKDKDHISKILQQLQGIAWYHYVCIGNLTKVEELFEAEHPDRIKRLDKALELAAEHNQTEVFDWTLGKYKNFKPDYNILSQIWSGDSAGIAIKKGHQKIIECVLSSVDEKTLNACDFRALLSLAASYDRLEIIELILDKLENVSINISKEVLIERYKYSFLCYLAEKGHSEILNKLLNRQKWLSECLSEVTNQDNKNLLIIAIENRQINMVGALLESNSAERSKFLSGYPSPLIVAAKRNDIEIMHILLKYTDSFYEKDQYGKTALMVAAELGYGEIVTLLLNHPVINKNIFYSQRYLNQKTLPGELDALALAAKNGHLDVTKILLSHPLKYPDIPPVFDFKSALLQAVRFEHIEVFKLIANCEACSIRTVIDVACDSSNIELIKFIFPRFKTLGDLQNEIQIFDSEKQNEVTKSYLQSLSSQSIKTEDNQQNLHNTSTNRFGFWSPSKSTDNAPEAEKTQLEIKSENSFQNVLNNKLN